MRDERKNSRQENQGERYGLAVPSADDFRYMRVHASAYRAVPLVFVLRLRRGVEIRFYRVRKLRESFPRPGDGKSGGEHAAFCRRQHSRRYGRVVSARAPFKHERERSEGVPRDLLSAVRYAGDRGRNCVELHYALRRNGGKPGVFQHDFAFSRA